MRMTCLNSIALAGLFSVSAAVDAQTAPEYSCGYAFETGTHTSWPGGHQAWTKLINVDGEVGTRFSVYLDLADVVVTDYYQAEYQELENAYLVTEPSWLQWQTIPQGQDFTFAHVGAGEFGGITPYLISVNGEACDPIAPSVELTLSQALYTANDVLTLSAMATDNVAVRKVVFYQNGMEIGADDTAPYSLEVDIDESLNGRHGFYAVAYDPSGNDATSVQQRMFVAIGNRFLGTAPSSEADYVDTATYFNQVTPENAGKWGSVESVRDEMNWTDLDVAYEFAKANGFPFKLHTLIWGQQAPEWMDELPADEQLAEIEEWMSLLAERYPDVETIDVVNEPLHAPPSFTEALGGDGESGWDWVLNSFALARQYFPEAELLINDYQILILENFVNDYLQVINPLIEADLLDGIGVQAHFLERADIATVESSLASLAATGLPIYISEFDVNIADDAHHANRVKDLFTAFWSNPSVVGVTHWGHLEGDIWRENAYLIRQDGSLRPGFEWMLCFYAGGDDCEVPEYIHPGWQGGANGLLLQAEEYDEGVGIAALGNVIAYVDDGDWISYKKVSFEDTWDELSITYLKGNEEVGTLSFHLDSLDSEAIFEVDVESTGGWGTALTLDVPWVPFSGEHDLYILFSGGFGVANVDSIHFHPPLGEPGFGPNLISNPGFEDGTTSGWFTWDGALSATDTIAYEGEYSMLLSERSGNGPAAYGLTNLVTQGADYQVRMYVSVNGADSADVNVTAKTVCGEDENYAWIINPVTAISGEWVELSGTLSVPECELNELLIFAEGPSGGIDILIDEVSVRQILSENLIPNGSFEDGSVGSWFSWDGSLSVTSDIAYEGENALSVAERSGNGPAAYNLTSIVEAGQSYAVSMAATIAGAAEAPLNITQKIQCTGDDAQYSWLANTGAALEGEWSILSGSLDLPECELAEVLIYLEGPVGGIDLLLDDVSVTLQ